MTVVLSLVTAEGVVIASDSQITDADRGMSFPAQKLHDLGDRAAWGGSGARSVLNDIKNCFNEESAAIVDAASITHALQERVVPILRHHYENFIGDIPGEEAKQSPSAYVLAAGYSQDAPWIIEVNPNGMVSHYDDVGFHAIGSGAPMAQQASTLLGHFQVAERSIRHGVVAAARVLDALSFTSPSVGGPFDICRITPDDGAHHLTEDEIADVWEDVQRWTELERKAIDKLFD